MFCLIGILAAILNEIRKYIYSNVKVSFLLLYL
jgi:hypothetical protein